MNRLLAVALAALFVIPVTASSAQPTFRERYNVAAKDMVPMLQISDCKTKTAKAVAGKAIIECRVHLGNSLLSLDSMNNKLAGVWLVLDASELEHPSDLVRSGGILLRAARGTAHGDYLAVASNVFSASKQLGGKEACVDDKEAASRFCVSSDNSKIFHITLTPM